MAAVTSPLLPRKLPRQRRSRATVEAILEACARILRESGQAGLTTNRIAERAGVGIGSVYQFFPNREAIIVALAEQRLAQLGRALQQELEAALPLPGIDGIRQLLTRLLAEVGADRELYRLLLREASLLRELPEVQRAINRFHDWVSLGAHRAGGRVNLPAFDADIWLIVRMVGNALLDIAFDQADRDQQDRLIEELARLSGRMIGLDGSGC